MTHLFHDSLTKQRVKDALYSHLYQSVRHQFDKRLEAIIIQNAKALSSAYLSFIYQGEVYACEGERLPRRLNPLVPTLHPAMNEYLKDLKEINKEVSSVLGFIDQVLNASNSLQDYLRVLPAAVHEPIQKLIDTCPCRTNKLTNSEAQALTSRSADCAEAMSHRMTANLLIQGAP